MRRRHRIFSMSTVVLTLSALISVGASEQASAYNPTGCHWAHAAIDYGTPANSTYVSPTVAAAVAWTNTPTPIYMLRVAGSPVSGVEVSAANYGSVAWDGYSSWNCSTVFHHTTAAWSRYNTYHTDSYSATGKKQLMVHELGHTLGLAHAGTASCAGQPIMYIYADRYFTCGHVVPQADDIRGINAIY